MPQTLTHTIPATPERVFHYLTTPQLLRRWASSGATHLEASVGGFVALSLPGAPRFAGDVTAIVPGQGLTLTAPGLTVQFALAAAQATPDVVATTLTTIVSGPGVEGAHGAAVIQAWQAALHNLVSIFATGIDLRLARQARLGVSYDMAPAERGPGHMGTGVVVTSVQADTGAAQAGLHVGDLITRLGDTPLVKFDDVTLALAAYKPGAVARLAVVRAGKTLKFDVVLNGFQPLDLPATREDVMAVYKEETDRLMWLIAETCDGFSEFAARKRPANGGWSANEALAHLIVYEQDKRFFAASFLADSEPTGIVTNLETLTERLVATIAGTGDDMWTLLDGLRNEFRASLAFMRATPDAVLAEPLYFRVFAEAFHYVRLHGHTETHLFQLRDLRG